MGKLYLVPTPIGNLRDMTFRAIDVLRQVDLIAAEDTRVTLTLLSHFEIKTSMTAYHEHNAETTTPKLIAQLKHKDIALVTDAGSPGISDPGYLLVREALAQGYDIIPLPGPNAFVPALIASGLPTDTFFFQGFLPKRPQARKECLVMMSEMPNTCIIYESPYRIIETMHEIGEIYGDRPVVLAREISKKHETFIRMSATRLAEIVKTNPMPGELVVVLPGADKNSRHWAQADIITAIQSAQAQGMKPTQIAKDIAKQSGWSKPDVYQLLLKQTHAD